MKRKKVNVIFLGAFLYPNGYAATNRKQQFLDYIISQGDSARVLITYKLARGNELNDLKGTYKSIPYEVLGADVKPNILLPITFFLFLVKTLKRIYFYKKKDCHNIIVSFGINFDTLFNLWFAKIIGYKIVFDIVEDFSTIMHDQIGIKKVKFWVLHIFPHFFLKYLASGISVITNYLKDKYIDTRYKVPIEIVPISASNLLLDLDKNRARSFRLLYSGTYGDKEGLPILFEGFKKFIDYEKNSELMLTGECPEQIKNQLMDHLDGLNHVVLTGRLEDNAYFQALMDADVLLMTRINTAFANAGFPYKLGEYLATGNPVICTKVSDIEIYLKDRDSAFLINPNNSDEIFNVLKYIYHNRDEALKIGAKGKVICKTHFNPEINSKLFYSLLRSI